MAEVVRVLMEVDADMKPLTAALNKVNEEFGVSNQKLKETEDQVAKLMAKEQQLIDARSKANNPSMIVKYNEEIKKTRTEISNLTASIDKANAEQKEFKTSIDQSNKSASTFSEGMKKAFNVTSIKAAKKAVEEVGKEVDNIGKGSKGKNALGEIPKAAGAGAKSMISLKKEFRELQMQLEQTEVGTKEYIATLKRLGEVKDDIGDLKDEFNALGTSQGAFKAIGNTVSGIAGGFSAAQGAAALFGQENEDVQESLLKVQAALALSQGVEQVLGLKDAFNALKLVIIANPLFTLATVVLSITGAFIGMDNIMTGISATFDFLGNVGSAVVDGLIEGAKFLIDIYTQYLDLLTFGLFDINGAYKGYVNGIEDANAAERKRIELVKQEIEANKKLISEQLKLADAYQKSADAIQKLEDAAVKNYEHQIALNQALGKDTEELEAKKLDIIRKSTEAQIVEINKKFEAEQLALKKSRENIDKGRTIEGEDVIDAVTTQIAVESRIDATKVQLKDLTNLLDETLNSQEILEAQSLKKRQDKWREYANEVANIIKELQKELQDINDESVDIDISGLSGTDKINAEFDQRKKIFNRELDARKESLEKEGKLTEEAEDLIGKIRIAKNNNFEKQRNDQIEKFLLERMERTIEANNELAELEIALGEMGVITEKKNFEDRIAAAELYYGERINMAIKMGESEDAIRKLELEQAIVLKQLKMEQLNEEIAINSAMFDEETRHELAMLQLRKASEVEILRLQIDAEKERLKEIEKFHDAESLEVIAQKNKILELEGEQANAEKELSKEKTIQILDDIQQILDATLQAVNQVIGAKIQETDALINLQQQRVNEAAQIAEEGNAELLELEKKRLDDLNKEKEKFVRTQQALAVVELIANSSIAIAKAAAEGGAAAPITIAATLIALLAGLAQARQIASQAAFFKGGLFDGQGYTGDGNPYEESKMVGDKPYTYHKREFIFNHQTTEKYNDIFSRIHGGNIDLKEWESKVQMFDAMNIPSMQLLGNMMMPIIPQDNSDLSEVKDLLKQLIGVTESQPHSEFHLDQDGFTARLHKFVEKKKTIDLMTR